MVECSNIDSGWSAMPLNDEKAEVLEYRTFDSRAAMSATYTHSSHTMLAICALQTASWIEFICVTRCQTDAPFFAGLAALTEEHLAIFALSAFDLW
jgi:hypothetical protein